MRDLLPVLVLGLIQGITEFLPISSDGHLALAQLLFDLEGGLALTVLLHAGTFLATLIVLRQRAFAALGDGLRAFIQPQLFRTTSGGQDALFVLVASIPTAAIGLGLKHTVEAATSSPLWIGFGFLLTGAILFSTRFLPEGKIEHPDWRTALLVGLLQGLAVLPGVSRSGSTIAALLFLKVERPRAFELSMLLSLPAVLGALVLELPDGLRELQSLGPALLATVVAFVSGVFALVWLRKIVSSGMFPWFAFWVVPLGFATLAMAAAWPH